MCTCFGKEDFDHFHAGGPEKGAAALQLGLSRTTANGCVCESPCAFRQGTDFSWCRVDPRIGCKLGANMEDMSGWDHTLFREAAGELKPTSRKWVSNNTFRVFALESCANGVA